MNGNGFLELGLLLPEFGSSLIAIGVPAPPFAASVVFLILIVFGIPLVLLGASIFFLTREKTMGRFKRADLKTIGSSLLTGSIVSLAIFGLQFYLNQEDASKTKEEQFRLTLAVSKDLEGLDPPLSLAGLNLPDKNLDQAQLTGEDLTDTNLAGSTLRNANLGGANLEGANLYGADLRGALLTGADLDDANLASANLRDTQVYGLEGVELELDGTDVDARTCWPADFLIDVEEQRLRNRLDPQSIVETGRELREPSTGHACELTFDNVVQHLEETRPPKTLDALAGPYDFKAPKFLDMVDKKAEELPANARPLGLKDPLCARSHRVLTRGSRWQSAAALLIIKSPTQRVGGALPLLFEQDQPDVEQKGRDVLLEPSERLASPVAAGSTVWLFGVVSSEQGVRPDYATRAQVSAC